MRNWKKAVNYLTITDRGGRTYEIASLAFSNLHFATFSQASVTISTYKSQLASTESFDGLNGTAGRSDNSSENVESVLALLDHYLKMRCRNHSKRRWWLWNRFKEVQCEKFIDVVLHHYH
ncbi:hypothetical protein T02_995 [Trichinella nativa]|uniref:Uncharacterized protein n=1 Tax=Trichinella nativa TaxID=6335 RepID=A0A0V1L2Y2_9BILA|nr:hypothetical protein T02_995 [Trichinella nativa]